MDIDLRKNCRGNSAIVVNNVLSENSKEYWCYPSVEVCIGNFKFGTLYVDKDSEYGKEISNILETSPCSVTDINNYCLEVICKHLFAKDLHDITMDISHKCEAYGINYVKTELRRVIGY